MTKFEALIEYYRRLPYVEKKVLSEGARNQLVLGLKDNEFEAWRMEMLHMAEGWVP